MQKSQRCEMDAVRSEAGCQGTTVELYGFTVRNICQVLKSTIFAILESISVKSA